MKNLSDEETIRQFAFNIEWHYALGVTGESMPHREYQPSKSEHGQTVSKPICCVPRIK